MKNALLILVLVCLVYLQGCAMGYNSVLFVTKSNVGIDVDSSPPTAEISVGRVEGVVEPTFESGRTLPVMASFKPKSRGLVSGDVAQTFSTGEAAVAMATLYAAEDYPYDPEDHEWEERVEETFDSGVAVNTEPKLPRGLTFVKDDVKPVFFGTTTSLGVNVSWSGVAATFPDSAHIGFRRKELAWAPIAYVEEGEDKTLRAPSLLATIDQAVEVGTPAETELRWLQYFATGKSATALALRQDVRKAMLTRLDPAQAARFRVETANLHVLAVVRSIEKGLRDFAEEDATAERLANELDALSSLLPDTYAVNVYTFSAPANLTTETHKGAEVPNNQKFTGVVSYWSYLVDSKQNLINAIGTPDLQIDGVKASQEGIETLREELRTTDTVLARFQSQISQRSELVEAMKYYLAKITE